MSSTFEGVPLDPETRVILQFETQLGSYPVLYQKWFWDGITAESLIFSNDDIDQEDLDKIKLIVRAFPGLNPESDVTVKRSDEGYTFFNFNFEID